MTWVLIVWCTLILVWAIAGGASNHCDQQTFKSACQAGTGIGVAFILLIGFVGFLFFSLIWFMSRPGQGSGSPSAGKKPCPTCAEWIGEGASKCPHCGHAFAPQTLNRPAGVPFWPGFGRRANVRCSNCGDKVREFDDQGTCTKCGRTSELLRYYWGWRNDMPSTSPVEASS
jgi:hypothetical protein